MGLQVGFNNLVKKHKLINNQGYEKYKKLFVSHCYFPWDLLRVNHF
jgi:hypothetical protein